MGNIFDEFREVTRDLSRGIRDISRIGRDARRTTDDVGRIFEVDPYDRDADRAGHEAREQRNLFGRDRLARERGGLAHEVDRDGIIRYDDDYIQGGGVRTFGQSGRDGDFGHSAADRDEYRGSGHSDYSGHDVRSRQHRTDMQTYHLEIFGERFSGALSRDGRDGSIFIGGRDTGINFDHQNLHPNRPYVLDQASNGELFIFPSAEERAVSGVQVVNPQILDRLYDRANGLSDPSRGDDLPVAPGTSGSRRQFDRRPEASAADAAAAPARESVEPSAPTTGFQFDGAVSAVSQHQDGGWTRNDYTLRYQQLINQTLGTDIAEDGMHGPQTTQYGAQLAERAATLGYDINPREITNRDLVFINENMEALQRDPIAQGRDIPEAVQSAARDAVRGTSLDGGAIRTEPVEVARSEEVSAPTAQMSAEARIARLEERAGNDR